MKKFELLTEEFLKDIERKTADHAAWIADPERENGLRHYSTARRFEQYKAGEINRETANNYATKRLYKEMEKQKAAGLAKIEAAETAPDLTSITIDIEWTKSRTWGYNPHAEMVNSHETRRTFGNASGCGYDKRSAAVAEALNQSPAVLKILYTLKEEGLKEGKNDHSETACTGHDNRNIIGYGSGYSVIPYFEGGVGIECFAAILKKAGFQQNAHGGKTYEFYNYTR